LSNQTSAILLGHLNEQAVDAAILETSDEQWSQWAGVFTKASAPPASDAVFRGAKTPMCSVWLASFNWLDRDAFLTWCEALPWRHLSQVLLVLHNESEGRFQVMHLVGRRWEEFEDSSLD